MINETDSLGIWGSSASPAFQSERCQLFMVAGGGWPGWRRGVTGEGGGGSVTALEGKGVNQVKVDQWRFFLHLLCFATAVSVVFGALFCLFIEEYLT